MTKDTNKKEGEISVLDLKPSDKFLLNGEEYEVVGWKNKFMPTLGRVPNLITKRLSDGGVQRFISNIKVTPTTKLTN